MLAELAAEHPVFFAWVFLPVLIFVARTTDVGLSTLRVVFITQGRNLLAPLVGFFEALLWLFVISQILGRMSNPLCVVAYAGGFAMGNIVGLILERRLAMGMQVVRIIVPRRAEELLAELRRADYGVTVLDGEGASGAVQVLFTIVRRRDVPRVVELSRRLNPRSFISVEDVRRAEAGVFPRSAPGSWPIDWKLWGVLRKTK